MAIYIFKKTCTVEAKDLEAAIKKVKDEDFTEDYEIDKVIQ